MSKYLVINQKCEVKEYGEMTSFGIAAMENGYVVATAHDLTDNLDQIQRLVMLFNEEELETEHFEVCIEDFLSGMLAIN
ncbi:MAG: hypothetical protein Q8876_05525 [Bacillota bacterium]|nr:hypothetical protein [Bacillota bacterium]